MITSVDTHEYLRWLETDAKYKYVRLLPDGRWAAVFPLMYTGAIIVGRVGNMISYDDRWCYLNVTAALTALDAWDGSGEPSGWHRHPATGRRRPDGDELLEYLHF